MEVYIHSVDDDLKLLQQQISTSNNTKDTLLDTLRILNKGKLLGRKYALIEAGNIAWDCGEKILAQRYYDMAKLIKEV